MENSIVMWAVECSKRGFGKTGKQIRQQVKQLLDASGRTLFGDDNLPSIGWLQRLRARYPEVKFKKTEGLEEARSRYASEEGIRNWFVGYQKMLREEGITSPSQIFNCDESGFALQHKGRIVLCERESKSNYHVQSNSKEQITVLVTISADGRSLPPFVLWGGRAGSEKHVPYTLKLPKPSISEVSEKGWMTKEAFYMYMEKVFCKYQFSPETKKILLCDWHTSH